MRQVLNFLALIGFVIVAFVCSLLPGGVWAALLTLNLRSGIGIPWAVPAMLALLAVGWLFAGGRWPWHSSKRAAYRRANPLSPRSWGWALLANTFSLAALATLWIVLHRLVKTSGNPVPDFSSYPLPVVAAVLGCAAIVGAVGEEVALRGYLLGRLERVAYWPIAVVLTALIAAPGHALSQGFVWTTVVFYLLADVVYGVTAVLTDSILPGIVSHAVGLFVFFAFIWPYDKSRGSTSLSDADPTLWTSVGIVVACGVIAAWAFVKLGRRRNTGGSPIEAPPASAVLPSL